jgi:hypothetical protein
MNGEAPHPVGPRTGAGPAFLRLLLWLFVLLAGLAVVLVLPMILVLTALGEARPGNFGVYVWVPFAFLAALFSVISGLQAMADPRPRMVALLAGLALLAFLTFPPFWFPES